MARQDLDAQPTAGSLTGYQTEVISTAAKLQPTGTEVTATKASKDDDSWCGKLGKHVVDSLRPAPHAAARRRAHGLKVDDVA